MIDRPTTTARAPFVSISYSASIRMIPSGVPGNERRPPEIEPAGVHRVEAVDVLRRVDRLDRSSTLVEVRRAAAAGRGSRPRSRRRSGRRGAARSSSSGVSAGSRRSFASMPTPARPCACRGCRRPRPDRRRRARSSGPTAGRAISGPPPRATSCRRILAVDRPCRHQGDVIASAGARCRTLRPQGVRRFRPKVSDTFRRAWVA